MLRKSLNDIVGGNHVFDDPETLDTYSQDRSFFTQRRPTFVASPKNTEEVQAIVKLANKTLTPITPVSSMVHYYGATIPQQGGILLDLHRMNKIANVDRRNRAVRFQPGVTWADLKMELRAHGLMPLMPLMPHSQQSALTSTLEREPVLIPKTEYGEPILTMEAVLPNGDIFRTGSAAVGPPGETNTDMVGQSGPGIDWFRLFQGTQGTFCIVTWINMKAPPLPKKEKVFIIPIQKIENVIEPLYAILRRMLGAECFILNRFNLACILAKKGPDNFKTILKELPPFSLVLCLSGGKILPKAKIEYQENDLREISRKYKIKLSSEFSCNGNKTGTSLLNLLRSNCKKEPYWKERYKERCCDIFFYTTLDRVPFFTNLVTEISKEHTFPKNEIGIYLQPLEGGRACSLEFNLPWNRDEKEKVYALYKNLSSRLAGEGAFFGRPYGEWSKLVYTKNDSLAGTLRNLKNILDPNRILNPGRLCF